jgi:adenine-specific DNA-methyltransferase
MADPSKRSKLKELKSLVQKMDGNSYNPQAELLELLKSKCPEAFTEGKIDPKKLRQTLGAEVSEEGERYGLSWAGKSDCFRHIQEPTTATLKPIKKESIDFDKTENIFIEGDNLEVLKALQKSYYGSIKMIYIDPPYNTGNDSFIYPDRYKEEKEDYELRAGIKDAEGLLTKDGFWRKNSKDAGYFHSNWLSMMYPRLFLAKNLLREDGVIFVSIDDNEVHNLRMIMAEVFGEENFVDTIIWKKRYGGGAKEKYLISMHEYVLFYAKNKEILDPLFIPQDLEAIEKYYKLKDEKYEIRGPYRTHPLEAGKAVGERKNLVFPIPAPDGTKILPKRQWYWMKERVQEAIKNNELEFVKGKDGWTVHTKQYLKNENGEIRTGKAFSIIDDVYTQHGTNEIIDIFGNIQIFPYPKPTGLIEYLLKFATDCDESDIVLDFFAGSCTTAHAVMQLNAEDGGNRKFICVQLAEPCEENSEAFKAGFKTISDIGKERIRRAAKKIKEENKGKLDFDKTKLDLGFKVFKLSESNFKQWRENIKTGEELKEQMKMFVDNTKKESRPEDMLYEIILKNSRFDLNVKISKESFDGVDYYRLADGVEIICLAPKITKKSVDKIISLKPEKFTCLDTAFKNNDQLKTNTALQMEAAKIEFKVI